MRVIVGTLGTLGLLVAALAAYAGITLYQIDHAVHHVEVPSSLLAKGQDTLLAVVKGPDHTENAYLFHTSSGHTNVLILPTSLAVTVGGRQKALSSLDIHAPVAIISGLRQLGIPVARYVAVDLHTVSPNSSLGRLATGKISITGMLTNPTGTMSMLKAVATHVYLGPNTSVSALLELTHVPTTRPVHIPTSRDAHGTVVLASPFVGVLRHFL